MQNHAKDRCLAAGGDVGVSMGDCSHQLGPERGTEALKLLSLTFLSQQVPALIAKAVPTVNAINYALGSEMVHRGIWQCLSPQKRERDREQ